MIFDKDPSDPACAKFAAEQIAILDSENDKSQIGVNVAAISDQGNTQGTIPDSLFGPRVHYVAARDFSVIFIGGTRTLEQATNLVSAWSENENADTAFGIPNSLWDWSFRMSQLLGVRGFPTNLRTYVFGHSLGGVLAQVYAVQWRSYRNAGTILPTSFGSPRVGRAPMRDYLRNQVNVRWMLDNDPVPLLPPAFPFSFPFLAVAGYSVIQKWESLVHAHGGIVVDALGRSLPGVVPPLGTVEGAGALAAWLLKVATDQASNHSIGKYVERLTLLAQSAVPPTTIRVVEGPGEVQNTTPRQEQNQAARAYADTIVRTGAAQNAAALRVPRERAFTTFKSEGFWYVAFGGIPVAVGGTRKRASMMAIRGNEYLRRLQRMAGVDIAALNFLMPIYLQSASTEGNGFNPLIKDMSSL